MVNSMLNYQVLSRKKKRQNKGFTLIELLVAITLLSIVLGLFYSTWWISVKTTKRTHEIAQKYMGVRSFLNTLAMELKSSFDLGYSDYPNFYWGPDENNPERKKLEFWVTAPDEIPVIYTYPFYIHRVTYYFDEENGKKVISKRVEALDNSFPPIEGPVLEGDFNIDIEVIQGKTEEHPLPEKVIVTIILEDKYPIRKEISIYELKQSEYETE